MSSLKLIRKAQSLKQVDLAEMLGVDRSTVTKWESGIALPRVDNLLKMAIIFDCSMDVLLKEEKEKIRHQMKGEKNRSS